MRKMLLEFEWTESTERSLAYIVEAIEFAQDDGYFKCACDLHEGDEVYKEIMKIKKDISNCLKRSPK